MWVGVGKERWGEEEDKKIEKGWGVGKSVGEVVVTKSDERVIGVWGGSDGGDVAPGERW
jgi:hypothetical protein